MKKLWLLLLAVILGGLLVLPAPAAAADSLAGLRFNDSARAVTLAIPTSSCRPDHRGIACSWALFVDEPFVAGQPVVGMVTGTSGVLSLPYPQFCGVLQADAVVWPPMRKVVGRRHQVNVCSCPSPGGQISLSSYARPAPTTGGTGPDELILGFGSLALAAAIVWRKRRI